MKRHTPLKRVFTLTQYSDTSLFLKVSPLNHNLILIYDIKEGLKKNTHFQKGDPRTRFFNKFRKLTHK